MMPVDADPDDVDAAGLPDRLLRKAETAIHGRTSRVVCVIERCTDEHNYSAVIRTAEALGVQHIWLVDPVVQGGDEDLAPESAAPDAGAPGGGGATTAGAVAVTASPGATPTSSSRVAPTSSPPSASSPPQPRASPLSARTAA